MKEKNKDGFYIHTQKGMSRLTADFSTDAWNLQDNRILLKYE